MTDTQRLAGLQEHLCKEIISARSGMDGPLSSEDVTSIVRQVIESLGGDVSTADLKFYSELEDLARYIRQAKQDITSITPKDISTDHIPRATEELDAVVGATEDATNKIMDVCDEIAAIAGTSAPEINEKLSACTTKIFEACNFQDITGQRITKVVETLKYIDAKIETLVKVMGDEIHRGGDRGGPKHIHAADPDKGLLNGPQLPKDAVSQDEIDRVLSGK
jgi:chemotaxis protein CheZ